MTLDSLLTNEWFNLIRDCMDKRKLSIRPKKVTVTLMTLYSLEVVIYHQIFHGIYHTTIQLLSILLVRVGGCKLVYELNQ